jgi:selenocysteine-specific elongation factor
VSELDKTDEGITVISFKNRLGCGRKLAIDILEYFDAQRFTQRRGDSRVIIDGSIPAALFGE